MEYKTINSLQDCINESHRLPICILKHSTTCPTSFYAKQEVDQFLNKHQDENKTPVYLLIVQSERPLSNEIAETFNVRHESPQFLIVKDGKAEKVFNHGEITSQSIESELANVKQ